MFDVLLARWQQKHRTMRYPDGPPPELPPRFTGRPVIEADKCRAGCEACVPACPVEAITHSGSDNRVRLDLGRCIFCRDCERACPEEAIRFTREHRMGANCRTDLLLDHAAGPSPAAASETIRRLFGRSLKLRQVSAAGCNACEADTNVLGTVAWDLGRFGVQFVASPRHADGLLITGPVSQNMRLALEKTYQAVPSPKIVIAVGACAIAGGPFYDHDEVCRGADQILPVDLYVPGCPPHPLTILDAILRFLGRVADEG